MIKKYRHEPLELVYLRSLYYRTNLSPKYSQYYRHLERGFTGELQFDTWASTLTPSPIMLHDVSFEINYTHFQIDSLFITPNAVYLFEVKNYKKDFYMKDGEWFTLDGKEIKNPLRQLKRSQSLLRQLFQQCQWNLPVRAYLIFMNPSFTLYTASFNTPILLPSQHQQFKQAWQKESLPPAKKEHELADRLLQLQTTTSFPLRIPEYSFAEMKKGMLCSTCYSFLQGAGRKLLCPHCRSVISREQGVLQGVSEFKMLFPNTKITTNTILEWCRVIPSPKAIQRILAVHYKQVGKKRYTYYV